MRLCFSLESMLRAGRRIWPAKMAAPDIVICMGKVFGDVCRGVRDSDPAEVENELGNMIFSCIRWADDLGFDPENCVRQAMLAQQVYADRQKRVLP